MAKGKALLNGMKKEKSRSNKTRGPLRQTPDGVTRDDSYQKKQQNNVKQRKHAKNNSYQKSIKKKYNYQKE